MTSFVAANVRVVSRGREPVNVSLRDPAPDYYLPPASNCMFHNLPKEGDAGPVEPRPPGPPAGLVSYPGAKSGSSTRPPHRPAAAINPHERPGLVMRVHLASCIEYR
jgi:hypothetical protein